MNKILTLLAFVFMTNGMLLGQCPIKATPSKNANVGRFFNMTYSSAADKTTALAATASITFPAGSACSCGSTITIPEADLVAVNSTVHRAVGNPDVTNFFDGANPYTGSITVNLVAGGSLICNYTDTDLTSSMLPVDLIAFDGTKKDRQINLTWHTASEINNEGFVIERGHKNSSGLEWNQLDFVRGNGTTDELQAYSFTDKNPAEGTNYYRLKQMDYDGEYEYSSVITVEYSTRGGSTIEIFPNPVKGQLTLTNAAGQATIYNALGQAVKQLTINANQATIQLADLLNGQYYLQVLQADGTVVTKQFSKVN